jgi:hypothetical protein
MMADHDAKSKTEAGAPECAGLSGKPPGDPEVIDAVAGRAPNPRHDGM